MKKRLLCVLLVLVMCAVMLGSTRVFASENEANVISGLTELEKLALEQIPAIKAHEAIYESMLINDEGEELLPEWYGGCYISEDNKLVIKIVQGYDEIVNTIEQTVPTDASYTVENTDISLGDLVSLSEIVKASDAAGTFSALTISQQDSVVYVSFPEEKEGICTYNSSRSIMNNEHIEVRYGVKPVTTSAIKGGDTLFRNENGLMRSHGTVGFCGTFVKGGTTYSGIVTAGHVAQNTALYFGYNNPLGNESDNSIIQYANRQAGDYALIPMGNNSKTNLVKLSSTTSGEVTYISEDDYISGMIDNRYVFKYGFVTGMTMGQITGYNTEVHYGNVYIEGLVQITDKSGDTLLSEGDSGGPVWGLTSSEERELMGVISGKESISSIGYYSPIYLTLDEFTAHNLSVFDE